MSKVSVFSYRPHVISFPWPHYTADNPCRSVVVTASDFRFLTPGSESEIEEEILKSYAEHPTIKRYLLAGNVEGLEIVKVDGQPIAHATALPEFYPGKSASDLSGMVAEAQKQTLEERRKADELKMNANKIAPDMVVG